MSETGPFTLSDYREAYRLMALTPRGAVEDIYRRIAAYNDPAIFITLRDKDEVLADAYALEQNGSADLPLFGIPVAIKDNINVAGLPTTAACPAFRFLPTHDADAVARLRRAGALIIGKTNLDQFATGLVGVRSPYGIPRNTFQADKVPGGSSQGSATAVAAGLVPIALGTDTAGSGRVPAGFNNIVGLKPSLGAVSTDGVLPACRTLDCVSIFALTVEDAWSVFELISGYDPADAYSRSINCFTKTVGPICKIGVPNVESRRFGDDPLAEAAFDRAVEDLGMIGTPSQQIEILEIDMAPLFEVAALLYDGPWVAERYQSLRSFIERSPEAFHPVTRAIIEKARDFSAADAFAGQYQLAKLRRAASAIWEKIDILLVPTVPRPHTIADLESDPIKPNTELGTYTNFVNLLDFCALAVPGRFRSDGFPAGVTLIAPAGFDAALANLGAQLHQAAGVPLGATCARYRPDSKTKSATTAQDSIEVVVFGAHLSGFPLNAELLSRNARFVRRATTTADYRFFALGDGDTHKPGLVRVPDGTGMSIEAEVWALPLAGFATFVAAIPPPLAIGSVRLSDGTAPKGFLVEAEATRAAEDISRFGGWRAYVSHAGI